MSTLRCAFGSVVLAGWVVVACCGETRAQEGPETPVAEGPSTRAQWQQKALRRAWTPRTEQAQTAAAARVPQQWSPNRRGESVRLAQAAATESPAKPLAEKPEPVPTPTPVEKEPASGDIKLQPLPAEGETHHRDMGGMLPEEPGDSCGGLGSCGDECGQCGGGFGIEGECYCGIERRCVLGLLRNMSFFAGVQGFKGPVDRGINGNFGFHEGLNFGSCLGDPWDFGYQAGFQAVQSNLSGFQVGGGDTNGRDQLFFTAGLFRRALCGGLQGGVVFDYMHDNYYDTADLKQLRSETSLVFDGCHEVGYWGAYGVSRDRLRNGQRTFDLLQPNDIFAGFYRRHFSGGGQGRLWAGATGSGEGILGADMTVPLGTSWALGGNFTYTIPKSSTIAGGQQQEAWSIAMQLVWYPGRSSQCVFQNPFQPLFDVADNSVFLVRRPND